MKKHGGQLKLNAHVDKILLEGKRASGVLLKDGSIVKARKVRFPGHIHGILSVCRCNVLQMQGLHCVCDHEFFPGNSLDYVLDCLRMYLIASYLCLYSMGSIHTHRHKTFLLIFLDCPCSMKGSWLSGNTCHSVC